MKKLLILAALLAALALAATGCSTDDTAPTDGTLDTASTAESSTGDGEVPYSELYRGIVTDITQSSNAVKLTLAQAAGTNYGSGEKVLLVTDDTQIDFTPAWYDYVEVYYTGDVILTATLLGAADDVNYNGALQEIVTSGDGAGMITMESTEDGSITMFAFDNSTKFNVDRDSLAKGDKLNILTTGVYTLSDPPEGFALEVSSYHA